MAGNLQRPANGTITLKMPTGNYKEDEGFARYHLRKLLQVKKLPRGCVVAPRK